VWSDTQSKKQFKKSNALNFWSIIMSAVCSNIRLGTVGFVILALKSMGYVFLG
jgi:hypothetical protein